MRQGGPFLALRALLRGFAGRTPCCGGHVPHGATHCPRCGQSARGTPAEGAVPLLAGLASAIAALGTAFLIVVQLSPEHAALLPATLCAGGGTAMASLPRLGGAMAGLRWALELPARAVVPQGRAAPKGLEKRGSVVTV
jgi:uncharacterized protein (DUF983 family)